MNAQDLPLTLFVDTSCPLCAREVGLLKRRADPQRLRLVDISAAGFDPAPLNISLKQLQNCLHARTASGTWLTDIDATLHSWRAAGLGAWVAPLAFAPLRPLWRLLYKVFLHLRPYLAWLPAPALHTSRCTRQCCGGEENYAVPNEEAKS